MIRHSAPLLAAFGLLSFLTPADSAPLAVEPALTGAPNYNAAALTGQSPGVTGFTGAWSGDSNTSVTASGLNAVTNGYSATGGAFSSSGGSTVTRNFDASTASLLSTAGEVWFSLLMRTNHQGGTNTVRLVAGSSVAASIGQRLTGVQIKLQDSGAATGGSQQLNGGGVTVAGTGEAFTLSDTGTGLWPVNTTFLLVGRVVVNRAATGTETLQFWKLSDASTFNPGAPFLTSSRDILTPAIPGFTGMQIQGNSGGDIYDEFRVGTSPSDVLPAGTPGLPAGFSTGANPALGWSHGLKATAQASTLTLFDSYQSTDAVAPVNRWRDASPETAFAGAAPGNTAAFTWSGAATDWEAGRFYHAWRDGQASALTSRLTITSAGDYDLTGVWRSHTVPGTAASVSIVVNGTTRFSGSLNGFAGTTAGTATASGPSPVVSGTAYSVHLNAGDQVDFVTLPGSPRGNVSVTASFPPGTVPPVVTSTVIINEFCASNSLSLRDEDGTAPDWIELYNGTGPAVDLTNWSLTDDATLPAKWVFPARTIGHGEHLVIFASEKDSEKRPAYNSASELHTNFKLGAGGEYLGLFNAAGTVVNEFKPAFPAQVTDISYGSGNNAVTGYMKPTPRTVNGSATAVPPTALPAFSVPSGLFTGTLNVNITGQLAGHTVRYTTDGSEPTLTNGLTFTAGTPISVTASTTLRARFYSSGVGGPLTDAFYTLRGTGAAYGITPATFAGSLPLLIIDAPSASAQTSTSAVPARITLIDRSPADQRARLTDPPAITTRGSVKVRGQYSSSFPKKGYAIEFWDAADQDRALPVLGMPAESDWILYAAYQTDTDFMRNVLMFELFNRIGRWAPRTRFVEVFFNAGASSLDAADYHGVYVLMEKIKRDPERVDIANLRPEDNAGEDLTGGYIIAHDKYSSSSEWIDGASGIPNWLHTPDTAFVVKEPNVSDITAAQRAYITNYLLLCDASIGAANFHHPVTGLSYRDYIAQDSFIDHHMLMAFAKNVDALRVSCYLQKDRGGKLRMSAVWDNDLSQDADTETRDNNPAAWNPDNSTNSSDFFSLEGRNAEGWFHRLHQDPDYLQEWVDRYYRWRTTGVLDVTAINTFLDQQAALLTTADNGGADRPITRNFFRWPRTVRSTSTNQTNAAQVIFGSEATSEISRHKTWLQQRLAFMDSYVLAAPASSVPGGPISAATPVTLTTTETGAQIYYTTDGSDPRAPGGAVAAGALTYTAPFQFNASSMLTARVRKTGTAAKHTEWSGPLRVYYIVASRPAVAGDLIISEVMYHPADPSAAEIAAGFTNADDFEFIELMVTVDSRINLYGAKFTAGFDFTFDGAMHPELLELNPGGRILLVKNIAAFTHRYGAAAAARVAGQFDGNDQLNNAGELITFTAPGGTSFSLTYSDAAPWPDADGNGSSIVLIAPRSRPDVNVPENWRASLQPGGNPGSDDALRFIGNPAADSDQDGYSDLLEYALGPNPVLVSTLNAGEITFTIPRILNADDALITGECSTDFATWTPAIPSGATANTLTFRVPAELLGKTRLFLRAAATLRQ